MNKWKNKGKTGSIYKGNNKRLKMIKIKKNRRRENFNKIIKRIYNSKSKKNKKPEGHNRRNTEKQKIQKYL